MRKITLGIFILIFSASLIIATPPAGNYTVGTHWCENSATSGSQEYVYEGGGNWGGPYACPNGCGKLGQGGQCKAGSGGGSIACDPDSSGDDGSGNVAGPPNPMHMCV